MCSLVLGYIGSVIHLPSRLTQPGSEYLPKGPLAFCMPWVAGGDQARGARWDWAHCHNIEVGTTISKDHLGYIGYMEIGSIGSIQLFGLNQLAESTLCLECSYERSSPDSPDASFQVYGALDPGVGILRPELRSTTGKFRIQPPIPGRRRHDPWHRGHRGGSSWERKPRKGWPSADEALPGRDGGDVPGAADAFPARDPRSHPALGMH